MSLRLWFPLIGNASNQGCDSFSLTHDPTFTTGGKISANCAVNSYTDVGQYYLTNEHFARNSTDPISIFTWVYMDSYYSAGSELNGLVSNHDHSHNNNTGSGFGLNLRNDGSSFRVSVSTSHTSGRTYSSYYGNTPFYTGSWHHVGFVYTGTRINFYLDGQLDGGVDFTSSYNSNNRIGLFCWSVGYGWYSSMCKLNDVRVYDHALSPSEVKEISKGLVLHYDFEDPYVEYTTNLVTSQYYDTGTGGWGGHVGVSTTASFVEAPIAVGNKIELSYSGSNDGGYGTYIATCACVPSTEYTYSVFIKTSDNFASAHPNFLYHYEYNSNGYVTEYGVFSTNNMEAWGNGWYRAWGTFTTNAATTRVTLYFFTYPYAAVTYWIGGTQFERGNRMTPYIWNYGHNYTVSTGAWGWDNAGTSTVNSGDTSYGVSPCYSITQTSDGNSAFCWSWMEGVKNKFIHFSTLVYLSGNISDQVIYLRSGVTDNALGSFTYQGSAARTTWPRDQWIEITCDLQVGDESVYFCTYTNNNGEKIAVNSWLASEVHQVYDSSGYGNNGKLVGDCSVTFDNQNGLYSLFNRGLGLDYWAEEGKAFVLGDLKNEMSPAQLTISFWANIIATFNSHSGVISLSLSDYWPTDYTTGGLAQYDGAFRFNTTDGSPSVSQNISFNEWHHYMFVYDGATLSMYKDGTWVAGTSGTGNIRPFRYVFLGLNGAGDMWRKSQIKWGDFKLYTTALSAADVTTEYQRKAAVMRNGAYIANELVEYETAQDYGHAVNQMIDTNNHSWSNYLACITKSGYLNNFPGRTYNGMGTYQQAHMTVEATANGVHLYSPANWDGRAISGSGWDTWGGFCWSPMAMYDGCLVQGHRYILSWHVSGQSSAAMSEVYFSSQVGWGTGYTNPSTTTNALKTQPDNFQGEMDCYWDFTINDAIFKVCVDNGGNTSFTNGETYLSYAALKLGYPYRETGSLGTDIYITDIQLFDITTNRTYKIDKQDFVKATEFRETDLGKARIHSSGVLESTNIIER